MKPIAVLVGGYSSEAEISVKSGNEVASNIDSNKYEVVIINISKEKWEIVNGPAAGNRIDKSDFSYTENSEKKYFYCIVPFIHGTPGEDGLLQSYFDMLNIPYIGSNRLASALTFNKYYCNKFLQNFGVNIADSVLIRKNDKYSISGILEQISLPCFVKPNAGGSSFGITKVKHENELEKAIQLALGESDEVIIETGISGREFTCGMIHNNDETQVLPLVEIVSKNEFFDYQAKYNSEFNKEICPAPISEELTRKCSELSVKICRLLNTNGIMRIDYILNEQEFYFIEINTIPGMTNQSIVPKMLREKGLPVTQVFTDLIEEAVSKMV